MITSMAGSSRAQVFLVSAREISAAVQTLGRTLVPIHLLVDLPRRHEQVRELPCRELKVLPSEHGPSTTRSRTICGNRVRRFNSTLPRDDSPRLDDPPVETPYAEELIGADAPKRGWDGSALDEAPLLVGRIGAFIGFGVRRMRIKLADCKRARGPRSRRRRSAVDASGALRASRAVRTDSRRCQCAAQATAKSEKQGFARKLDVRA